MRETARGQSETVGIVLLTAVFVIVAVTVGVFVLSDFDSSGATGPTVDIGSDIRGQDIVIEHRGGDSFDADDIAIVVRGDFEQRWRLSEFDAVTGEDGATLSPGDRWVKANVDGLLGEIDLLVVDTVESEVIHDAAFHVREEGIVLTAGGERTAVELSRTESVPYTVSRVFGDGSRRDVTESAVVASDSGAVSVDESIATLTGVSAGEATVSARANGYEDTLSVRTLAPPELTVTAVDPAEGRTEGEDVPITVTVRNDGEESAQDELVNVETTGGGSVSPDSVPISLDPGATTTAAFTYDSVVGDAEEIDATAITDDDSRTVPVAFERAETNLYVESISANDPVTERETLAVEVTVTNDGSRTTDGQTVTLTVNANDGSKITDEAAPVSVDPGNSTTIEFSYGTGDGDAPAVELEATTEDDPVGVSETATVEDRTPGSSELIGIEEGSDPLSEDDSFDRHLTYSNPAGATGDVTVTVEGDGTDASSVTFVLEPGEARTPTGVGFPENGSLGSVNDDADARTVVVEIDD